LTEDLQRRPGKRAAEVSSFGILEGPARFRNEREARKKPALGSRHAGGSFDPIGHVDLDVLSQRMVNRAVFVDRKLDGSIELLGGDSLPRNVNHDVEGFVILWRVRVSNPLGFHFILGHFASHFAKNVYHVDRYAARQAQQEGFGRRTSFFISHIEFDFIAPLCRPDEIKVPFESQSRLVDR
jgi:hypothetical protein